MATVPSCSTSCLKEPGLAKPGGSKRMAVRAQPRPRAQGRSLQVQEDGPWERKVRGSQWTPAEAPPRSEAWSHLLNSHPALTPQVPLLPLGLGFHTLG